MCLVSTYKYILKHCLIQEFVYSKNIKVVNIPLIICALGWKKIFV